LCKGCRSEIEPASSFVQPVSCLVLIQIEREIRGIKDGMSDDGGHETVCLVIEQGKDDGQHRQGHEGQQAQMNGAEKDRAAKECQLGITVLFDPAVKNGAEQNLFEQGSEDDGGEAEINPLRQRHAALEDLHGGLRLNVAGELREKDLANFVQTDSERQGHRNHGDAECNCPPEARSFQAEESGPGQFMLPQKKMNQNQPHDLQTYAADEEAIKLLLHGGEIGEQPEQGEVGECTRGHADHQPRAEQEHGFRVPLFFRLHEERLGQERGG